MLISGSCDGYMDQFSLDRLSDEVEIHPDVIDYIVACIRPHYTSEKYFQEDIDVQLWKDLPVNSQYTFHKQELLEFKIEPEDRIDSIMLKAGWMNLEAYSEFKHSGELKVTSSNIISETNFPFE